MLQRLVFQLAKPLCEHTTDSKNIQWEFESDAHRAVSLLLFCEKCAMTIRIPPKDLWVSIVYQSAPRAVPEKKAAEQKPPAPRAVESPLPVKHEKSFTPFDRKILEKACISTDDIDFVD